MYANVPKYLHGAAARSVFATIALLVDRGDVVCEGELDVEGSYRLTKG